MVTPTDQRRLKDGARAAKIDVSKVDTMTPDQLRTIYGELFDGAVALQSTDDLGSEDANKAAMSVMDTLVARMNLVNRKYKSLTGVDVWTGGKNSQ